MADHYFSETSMLSNAFLSRASLSESFLKMQLPLAAALLATTLLSAAPSVLTQDEAAPEASAAVSAADTAALKKHVDDFIHYILIGKVDLAQAAGEAVLAGSTSDADLATLVDDNDLADRLSKAISRSRAMGGVSDLATKIEDRVEDGRKALARNPQRIAESITMLSKTLREQRIAEERLQAAGEYAVPQLLAVIVDGTDAKAELAATRNLVALNRLSVLPLSMSLTNLHGDAQRKVVGILAEIGYPTALPFIVEILARDSSTPDVKAACQTAFAQLNGRTDDVSAQFAALARKFLNREDSLVPYAADATNNLWSFDSSSGGFAGLSATTVATSVFCDAMAMSLARRSLAADATNTGALAIYVAADLRRENTLGSDEKVGRYSPQFFATAAGPSVCAEVLSIAIDARDSALVRDAISVLRQTASGAALTMPNGRAPMLEALSYADRRVRLDAALAIAHSAPTQSFASDFSVVPTLASAISDSGVNRAAVLGGTMDDRQMIGQQLQSAGFLSVAGADTFDTMEVDVVKANGVDLVVVRGSLDEIKASVERVRASGLTSASPVLAISNALEELAVRRAFEGNNTVIVWTEGSTADSFRSAATTAMSNASGSVMDEAEGAEYALEAAGALRAIAFSGTKIFSINDAEAALLRGLASKQGGLRMEIAAVLAISASADAQRALIDAALTSSGEEQIGLCDLAAAAARKTGSKADERQLSSLRELIAGSEGEIADAAGRLYGSLDTGSAEAVKLITAE